MGSVPWPPSNLAPAQNPDNPAYRTIYGTPGRVFANQCRTKSNPWGWVPGSGGSDYPTPLDITYTADQWQQQQFDNLLANADALRLQGFVCPTNAAETAALTAKSPFLNPKPVSGVPNNTPLFNWSGGFMANPSGPALSFVTSRGSGPYQPGDTWTLKISGAAPNSPVTVSGSTPAGAFKDTPMGNTDGAGNWSKSGTFTADQAGNWSESWSVGGSSIGSVGFTIQIPSTPTTPGGQVIGTSSGAAAGALVPATQQTSSGFSLSSLPWYVWAAGAGIALYAMGGTHGR